jgi:nanoRNase/pAp phosphatase (c-di-AMP/oligoRNAs hydrolase)
MVDTQPGTGNNSLPENCIPDIVIDHHPFLNSTRRARLIDVRSRYGATATIILEYLVHMGIKPNMRLATALLYAIRSDTQDFDREAGRADIDAVTYLFPIANKRMLGEIQRGSVEISYFQMLAAALKDARIYNNYIIASLGRITNPDMIAEVADLLNRDEGINCTICFGFYRKKMLLSVRTSEPDKRADRIIRHIVAGKGTGGGHYMYAGGQITLKNETKSELVKLENIIRKKCLRVLRLRKSPGQKLIQT